MMRVGSEGLQTLIRGTGGTIHFKTTPSFAEQLEGRPTPLFNA